MDLECYKIDRVKIEQVIIGEIIASDGDGPLNDAQILVEAFRAATAATIDQQDVGVLFSGGLDSTIIAILASEISKVTLYSVGVEGSHDIEAGRSAAEELGLTWEPIFINEDQVVQAVQEMVKLTGSHNPVSLSFQIPMYFVSRQAKEHLLVSGQGADELFAGYARYSVMSVEEKGRQMETDMAKLMDETLHQEQKVALAAGKDLRYPFLHTASVDAVNRIPLERRVGFETSKELLREVGRMIGAGFLAERKKKAAQYGSGAMRALKANARRQGLTVRALIAGMSEEGR